ncbi:BTB/POZ protein [Trichoderma pleuroticola]
MTKISAQGDFAQFDAHLRLQIEALIRKTAASPAKMVSTNEDLFERHSYTLNWAIHRRFNTELFADVTIRLGDVELPAHGIILASQSEYFKTALESPMKEGIERKFEFSEGSMHAHWRMVEYIYTGQYDHDAAAPLGLIADDEDLLKDVRVYQLADYFQIENLKYYAFQQFKTRIKRLWVAESFVDCIRYVYGIPNNVSYDMRTEIAKIALKHLADLWDKKIFRTLIREGGDFVIDILKLIVSSN